MEIPFQINQRLPATERLKISWTETDAETFISNRPYVKTNYGTFNLVSTQTQSGSAYENIAVIATGSNILASFYEEYEQEPTWLLLCGNDGSTSCGLSRFIIVNTLNWSADKRLVYEVGSGCDEVGLVWEDVDAEDRFSVMFNSNGGSYVQAYENVLMGDTIDEPSDPTRDLHTFVAWYKEDTFETLWDFETDTVEDYTILYAEWDLDLDLGDDNIIESVEVNGVPLPVVDKTVGISVPSDISELTDTTEIIPSDISDLTDDTGVIPSDISELTDNTEVIPSDISDLTDIEKVLTISDDITSDVSVGGINAGDTVLEGTSLNELVALLLTRTYYPTYENPTLSIQLSGISSINEVGAVINVLVTANFGRGAIKGDIDSVTGLWDPALSQDYRSGEAINYDITGVDSGVSNVYTVDDYTVVLGSNTFSVVVTYAEGPQPVDSKGFDYGSPLAGNTISSSVSRSGVRRAFHGCSGAYALSSDIRGLSNSFLNPVNGSSFTIDIPSGATNVVIAYPANLRALTSVIYVEAMNSQIKDVFVEEAQVSVEGANGYAATSYRVYVYTPVDPFSGTATYEVII